MSSGRSLRLLLLMSNHCKLDIRSTQTGIEWKLFADTSTTVTCFRLLSQKEVSLYFSYILQIYENISIFKQPLFSQCTWKKIRISLNLLTVLHISHQYIKKKNLFQEYLPPNLFIPFFNIIILLNEISILKDKYNFNHQQEPKNALNPTQATYELSSKMKNCSVDN